jgi:hypothetical protein
VPRATLSLFRLGLVSDCANAGSTGRFGWNLSVAKRGREGLESLRVIRCLPVAWQCGALRGQASDKPRRRKPRAGMAQRSGALELWGLESRGQSAAKWGS